jgi:prepilin-type N-terminal cleavage/methylation domain-containing protein/prepilin-type processing-associated H-X9-DG protein
MSGLKYETTPKSAIRSQGKSGRNYYAAFTLLELLVVIAIISILASILFPVFARARAQARKTADISNLKQLSLAFLMYSNDNDERFLKYENSTSGGKLQWPIALYPYYKSIGMLLSPSVPEIAGLPRSNSNINDYMLNRFPSYGYNNRYLSEVPSWSGTNVGATLASAQEPARTALLVTSAFTQLSSSSLPLDPFQPAGGYAYVLPPSDWAGTSPLVNKSYGYSWPIHNGQFLVAFADGHVKSVTVAQLEDHTPNGNLWSLDKSVNVGCDKASGKPAWCS